MGEGEEEGSGNVGVRGAVGFGGGGTEILGFCFI